MNPFYSPFRPLLLARRRLASGFFSRAAVIACVLFVSFAASAQSAPTLISISPADGATNTAPRDSVVFEFDQPMDATFLQSTVSPTVIGNYHLPRPT